MWAIGIVERVLDLTRLRRVDVREGGQALGVAVEAAIGWRRRLMRRRLDRLGETALSRGGGLAAFSPGA